jgi:hypothetical protein
MFPHHRSSDVRFSHKLTTGLQFDPIPPKSNMSDALSPRTGRASDAASTSSLIPALRGPITSSPPSSPTLPQLPSSPSSTTTPSSHAATQQPTKSGKKIRSRSPIGSRSSWRGSWFAPPRRATAAQVLRASKSGVLALKIASLCVNSDALPPWALSMLVGLSIADSLSDNVALNLGFGVVHVVALKAFNMRPAE